MATLQVKHLPDELHALLVERARAQGSTMADYVPGSRLTGSEPSS